VLLEPLPTAATLAAVGALLIVSVLASRASGRVGVPAALVFLAIGMAAGAGGFGSLPFQDPLLAFRAGTIALVLILFDGGLNTSLPSLRSALAPATLLATVGVVGTAVVAALGAKALGTAWPIALLFGAVVSSTDAAAVFSVLRGAGIQLRRRVALILEAESGLNDPMAVILTVSFTQALAQGERTSIPRLALQAVVQLAVGLLGGVAVGLGGRTLLARIRIAAGGLVPVLTLALGFAAFGLTTLVGGSGFLAVYVAAVLLGNGPLPYLPGVRRVHDAMAWFAQISMFLLLGLLATPTRLAAVAGQGMLLALFLVFFARPAVATACLLPFRLPLHEVAFVAWVGLRGAVPIILATYPVLGGIPGAQHLFDLVFFVVVVSTALQGATIRGLARRLGLEAPLTPAPRAVLEIASAQPLSGEVLSFYVEPASAVAGSRIADLPFPEGAAVMLVVRGRDLLAPRGPTVLQPGDHVYVFTEPGDKGLVQLLFGREEEG
jgi:cell volume regulation protein A